MQTIENVGLCSTQWPIPAVKSRIFPGMNVTVDQYLCTSLGPYRCSLYFCLFYLPMNIEELRDFCLSLPGVTEHFPFDETTLVFKVNGKMFALTDLEGPLSVNLKCDPELALELREHYPAVRPGYHMNKQHWNTVDIDGSVSDSLLREWIMISYKLISEKSRTK